MPINVDFFSTVHRKVDTGPSLVQKRLLVYAAYSTASENCDTSQGSENCEETSEISEETREDSSNADTIEQKIQQR